VLVFDDNLRHTLGTKENIKRLVDGVGQMCSTWIGREIELYYAEDVRGPNGETGGIRIRIPRGLADVLTNELPTGAGVRS
jgi:hypothetical protein